MTEQEQKSIFSDNLNTLLVKYGKTQLEVAEAIDVSPQTFNTWCKGKALPRMGKVQKLADYFGINKSDLIEKRVTSNQSITAIRIPVYGCVAAGVPMNAVENILDYEEIPANWSGDYAGLRVQGHSMEPRICEGDVIIVQVQDYAESGDVVVAMVDDSEATVKKFIKQPDGIVLQPFNPAYEPMYFSREEVMNRPVVIWGVVVENRQKYK